MNMDVPADPNSSDEVVDFHLPSLLAQAREVAAARPELRLVGLVADDGTPEAADLRSKSTRLATAPDRSVSALITRDLAKDILLHTNAQMLDWLDDEGDSRCRKLPFIHTAKRGIRTGSIEYTLFA